MTVREHQLDLNKVCLMIYKKNLVQIEELKLLDVII